MISSYLDIFTETPPAVGTCTVKGCTLKTSGCASYFSNTNIGVGSSANVNNDIISASETVLAGYTYSLCYECNVEQTNGGGLVWNNIQI